MSLFGKNQRDEQPVQPKAPEPAGHPPGTSSTSGMSGTSGLGARPMSAPRSATDAASARGTTTRHHGEVMANIGKSITIKGDLTGNEDLQIEGSVEGRIDLPNNQLTIGAEGKVKAELKAKAVVVVGHVTGDVTATERIEVQATGVVEGDVRAPRLVVQEGAVLNGSVEMTGKGAGTTTQPQAHSASQPSSQAPRPAARAVAGGEA